MTASATLDAPGLSTLRKFAIAALALALLLLAANAWLFLLQGYRAVLFPYELDYGEGIVWQQAASMLSAGAYGRIDGFPAIVYHYPPLYHVVVAGLAALGGFDMLATGRFVSVAATLVIALLAGAIAVQASQVRPGDGARLVVGAVAGLSIFCCVPIILWSPYMRVDMVAVALSFAGLSLGLAALRRPALIHAAALFFVAAVYTKQTAIAAPAALFLVLLAVRPMLAIKGIGTTILAGSVVLAGLQWVTGGGFARHVFLYNVNRFDPARLQLLLSVVQGHLPFLTCAALIAFARWRGMRDAAPGPRFTGHRERLRREPSEVALLVVIAYVLVGGLMTLTVAKSGSSINYFVEWMSVLCILVGLACAVALRDAGSAARGSHAMTNLIVPMLIVAQGVASLGLTVVPGADPRRNAETAALVERIRQADKPVISDDMVVVMRGGKPVVWEPAIFAELAHTGAWDERPFVDLVCAQAFAFFVTDGERGRRLFDARYTTAVADAMDQAYPVRERQAGYVLHLPAPNARCAR